MAARLSLGGGHGNQPGPGAEVDASRRLEPWRPSRRVRRSGEYAATVRQPRHTGDIRVNQSLPLLLSLTVCAVVLPGTAHAAKADAVERLLADGKVEAAQARCERWEAWGPTEETAIREVCARAFWPRAVQTNTRTDWAGYRQQWSGTRSATDALPFEAKAALAEVTPGAKEAELNNLAAFYKDTPSAEAFRGRAALAAIRDASTAAEARAVATRWAGHPDLPTLVEAFPDAFVKVNIVGRTVTWTVDPPVPLQEDLAPTIRWVARWSDGKTQLWDQTARDLLVTWGLPQAALALFPTATERPSLPVCFTPGRPAGWGPGVELTVGKTQVFHPVPWDEGCGPDALPSFLLVDQGQVTALSLRPGHRVDLRRSTQPNGRRQTRGYLSGPAGTPLLWNGQVYERLGTAWAVTPLSGGTTWATATGPDPTAVPLSGELLTGELPAGWRVDGGQVRSSALDKLPPALRTWTLPAGTPRTVPPLVQTVLGLTADQAQPPRPPAPPLTAKGWVRSKTGNVQRTPPRGASIAGIYQLDGANIAAALRATATIGIPPASVEVLDGWKADLDSDGVSERILRTLVDGTGTLIVVDPLTDAIRDPAAARVVLLEAPRVQADTRPADTPFTFRRGQFVYLAWAGQEVLGATARQSFVQVLRSDGAGYRLDDLTLD